MKRSDWLRNVGPAKPAIPKTSKQETKPPKIKQVDKDLDWLEPESEQDIADRLARAEVDYRRDVETRRRNRENAFNGPSRLTGLGALDLSTNEWRERYLANMQAENAQRHRAAQEEALRQQEEIRISRMRNAGGPFDRDNELREGTTFNSNIRRAIRDNRNDIEF